MRPSPPARPTPFGPTWTAAPGAGAASPSSRPRAGSSQPCPSWHRGDRSSRASAGPRSGSGRCGLRARGASRGRRAIRIRPASCALPRIRRTVRAHRVRRAPEAAARLTRDTQDVADRLLLLDSNSLIYRGYFAIPPLTTTKGELVNAAFGFASILLKVLQEHSLQYIAACFDLPVPTFRKERDATYKAPRRPMPDDLRPQFERCKEFLDKFGVPMYSLPGYEADDLIGALAKQAEEAGLDTVILSGDLDTLQLVTPHVQLMTTRQGFQNTVIYNEEKIMERYGLRADQMIDYKALKGDPTDNIPGVPGVGEKTAAKLIAEGGNVEGVYERLDGLSPKLRAALDANREQVLHSREMSRIVTDIPVTLELDRARRGAYDRAAVIDLFRDLEFRSLIPRLPPADGNTVAPLPTPTPFPTDVRAAASRTSAAGQLSPGPTAPVPAPVAVTLLADADAAEYRERARAAGRLAVFADVDSERSPRLFGLGLALDGTGCYLALGGTLPAPIVELL